MKKINTISLIVMCLCILSCKRNLNGTGEIVQKEQRLTEFTVLNLNGNFDVTLFKDSIHRIFIETHSEVYDNLSIESKDGELSITEKIPVDSTMLYRVYIYSPHFNDIYLKDRVRLDISGKISEKEMEMALEDNTKFIGSLAVDELILDAQNNTQINLNGSAAKAEIVLKDGAIYNSPFFSISEADCTLKDSTQAKINVIKSLDGKGKGTSKLIYIGSPDKDYQVTEEAKIQNPIE